MRLKLTLAALLAATASSAAAAEPSPKWAIAIHGGAGIIERKDLDPATERAYRDALAKALEAGSKVLREGGSSLEAIEAAVRLMEDDPLFNAGRGAVFTAEGRNELDASIMNGADLKAGSVAGLSTVRHPISAARAVMEKSPHVMLIGPGAETFSRSVGLETVDPSFFFTERRWKGVETELKKRGEAVPPRPAGAPAPSAEAARAPLDEKKFGTVGVVALDSSGNLAAGTSTGGMTAKRWNRVGDAPLIGAGTYASNADGCAVSATGWGEFFIRATVARDVCARAASRTPLQAAADAEIAEVGRLGGDGGLVAIDRAGNVAFSMNTSGMYRATAAEGRAPKVAIFADEK